MDMNRIIHIACEAGKIILENGGETYRAEETMTRICSSYNINNSESYVTPTLVMISATNEYGQIISLIRRVTNRKIDLYKITLVNDLSRTIKINAITLENIEIELKNIKNIKRYNNSMNILASCLAAGFFTLVFGGNYLDFIISFIIGAIIKLVIIFLSRLNSGDFFINIVGGAISASIALISSYFLPTVHVNTILIGSIMLLVPGITIVNAIRDTISGDLISGMSRTLEAFIVAVAIAIGSGIIIKIWFSIFGTAVL
jgi:uncharacterized membrane protein YjjP (DUF1212 family)